VVALRQKHLWLSGKSIAAKHIPYPALLPAGSHRTRAENTNPAATRADGLSLLFPYFSAALLPAGSHRTRAENTNQAATRADGLSLLFPYQFFAYFGGFPLENTPSKR
jgi:hypothetical protein